MPQFNCSKLLPSDPHPGGCGGACARIYAP